MQRLLLLLGFFVVASALFLFLKPFGKVTSPPREPQPPLLAEADNPATTVKPSLPRSRNATPSLKHSPFTPLEIESITKEAGNLYEIQRKQFSINSDLNFELLEKQLRITQSWKPFGPFTQKDFPEIVNGHQAAILANVLNNARSFTLYYFNSQKSPVAQDRMENAIMSEDTPSLAIDVRPQFHFIRLTGREAGEFPKTLVPAVRKLWRNAMVQATMLTEQRQIWEGSLATIAQKRGAEFSLKREKEDAFPVLSSIDDKLMQIRKAYLGNLERLFSQHGLLDNR